MRCGADVGGAVKAEAATVCGAEAGSANEAPGVTERGDIKLNFKYISKNRNQVVHMTAGGKITEESGGGHCEAQPVHTSTC